MNAAIIASRQAPVAAVLVLAVACSSPGPIELVRAGTSEHRIVLEEDASPSEIHAAEVLQAAVQECSGVLLPIEQSSAPAAGPKIVLGRGGNAAALGVSPSDAELGPQGFVLRTRPPDLVIAGTREAGTMYGVHRFLEEVFGVRWLAPGVTLMPRSDRVLVPALDRTVRPAFMWRHTSYEWPGRDEDFRAVVADNAGDGRADSPYGLTYAHDGRAHSYFRFVSPDEFFDTHPEYFSEVGGVRLREETQLCLTNPEVLEIVTQRMLERMAAEPQVQQHNFSQMDHYNYCQCERCRAMNEKYGTAGGTQFWFVNQLAERTSAVYPDKLIGTLAYMYTEEPPRDLALHPNVAVWLCHMYPSCDSHPIDTCPLNADHRRRALAWAGIASHLYVWHYVTNFVHYYEPFPNLRAMAADMRFYRDIGVEGVYLQGMGHAGGGGEWSLLRPYYGMRLLWDPDQDPDRLIDEFLEGYHGAAWPPLRDYIDLLHDRVEQDDIHMHLYTNPAQGYLDDATLEAANRLFDRAERQVADDADLLERARVARMPLVYAKFFPRNGYRIEGGQLIWQGEMASSEELDEFIARMQAHGFETVREVSGGIGTMRQLHLILGSNLTVETIQNDFVQVDVVPMLAGRALRIAHKPPPAADATAYNVTRCLYFPFAGGLEDRIGEGFECSGWVEPAAVVARTASSITTRATTMDGLTLVRRLTLRQDAPVLEVRSDVVNPGDSPRTVRYRSHLELALGGVRQTRLRFQSKAGGAVDQDFDQVVANLREGVHYYAQDAPAGSWTFLGSRGLSLTQSFDQEALDFAWVYAYPEDLGEVELELWAKRVELGPGESIVFNQQIEIRPTP